METIKFERKNKQGEIIRARFIKPKIDDKKIPLVIMMTGDGPKGSNSLSWTNIPPRLARNGIASLLFDFCGLGNSEGKRSQLTLSKGIDDFKLIYKSINDFKWIDFNNIGIMGSSFGACVILHCYEIANSIKVLGLKSPSAFLPDAYLNEITKEDYEEWINTGFCKANGYEKEVLFDCFNYNIYSDAMKIKTTCLITHGDSDEIVPYNQSLYLKNLIKGETELITFKNGNHGYSKNDDWEKMAKIFIEFFKSNLK